MYAVSSHTVCLGALEQSRQRLAVFQLSLFLRALHPARTGLHPAWFTRALPEFKKKKN